MINFFFVLRQYCILNVFYYSKTKGYELDPEDLVLAGEGRLAYASDDHPPIPRAKIGIVIGNLGTPDATDYWSMRRYLSEFLSDRRVIDYSPVIWQPLLQLVILSKRPFSQSVLRTQTATARRRAANHDFRHHYRRLRPYPVGPDGRSLLQLAGARQATDHRSELCSGCRRAAPARRRAVQ